MGKGEGGNKKDLEQLNQDLQKENFQLIDIGRKCFRWDMLQTECLYPPNLHMLEFYLHRDGIRRWGSLEVNRIRRGHKGRVLINRIRAPIRVSQEFASSLFLQHEDTTRCQLYAAQKIALTRTQSADIMISDFQPQKLRNKFWFLINHTIYGILL